MLRHAKLSLFAVLVALPGNQVIAETSEETSSLGHGTRARLIKPVTPHYPRSQLRRGAEGWVVLNFVVTTDGTVVDPIVEDSSGSSGFEREALNAAKKWSYEPATWNGEPVEQCHTNVRIVFALAEPSRGASPYFIRRYKDVSTLISEGRTDEAEALLSKYFDTGKLNLYEISWVWILRANIAAARGNPIEQLRAMRKASTSEGKWIGQEQYRDLLNVMFWIEVEAEQYASAVATYKHLQEDPAEISPGISDAAEQIMAQINGPTVLETKVVIENSYEYEVGESPHWYHIPMRRQIEFADIVGSVDKFEIRCDWQRAADDVAIGKSWVIPESWGDCRLIVFGEEGASFKLLEFPPVPEA